jgi:hypothetical protein
LQGRQQHNDINNNRVASQIWDGKNSSNVSNNKIIQQEKGHEQQQGRQQHLGR